VWRPQINAFTYTQSPLRPWHRPGHDLPPSQEHHAQGSQISQLAGALPIQILRFQIDFDENNKQIGGNGRLKVCDFGLARTSPTNKDQFITTGALLRLIIWEEKKKK